ncbi:chaplin [Streptomyces cinerochromogenes]|uniref:chaplin n=1 Tax=Streptomyces cinerochromogenes TaxID=66422 RepID=UPI0036B27697
MRQTLSKGMAVAAAATGMLSLYGGAALADSRADGAAQGSPGVLSGNSVQAPVTVPVNVCGNSVDAAAALNPAFGNSCVTAGHGSNGRPGSEHHEEHGAPGNHSDYGTPVDHSGYGTPVDHPGHGTPGDSTGRPGPGGDHSTPPTGGGRTTPPPYGGKETPPPSYGGEETTPPPYGGETTPPGGGYGSPPGGGHSTPPGGGHSTPPGGGHTTPPYGGGESTPPGTGYTPPPGGGGGGVEHPGQPPVLAHTGGDGPAMMATSAASAALITAGAILYRRGRATARR